MKVAEKLRLAFEDPRRALRAAGKRPIHWMVKLNNLVVDGTKGNVAERGASSSGLRELDEVREYARTRTDISDHLVTLFVESLAVRPRLIVELGVRGGESTFALERVARLCGSRLVSVDLEDCSSVSTYERRDFIKSDDIAFARSFAEYCEKRSIAPEIDVLFVDTSHLFEHTVQEIEHWFPFLSRDAVVFFHDTNLKDFYVRRDGSMGIGWDNRRGVIAAIERYLQRPFDERRDFVDVAGGWLVRNHAQCAGLTG